MFYKLVKRSMARKLAWGLLFIGIFMTSATVLLNAGNVAWSATKICNFPTPAECIGSNDGDTMAGNGQDNTIVGCGGSDVMNGGDGADTIIGDSVGATCPANVKPGAERITAGPGNDEVFHGNSLAGAASDGQRDFIDCGPGDDTAWINVSIDNDVALNCEHLHVG